MLYPLNLAIAETGSFTLDHNNITIDLDGDYQNPVFFVQPPLICKKLGESPNGFVVAMTTSYSCQFC